VAPPVITSESPSRAPEHEPWPTRDMPYMAGVDGLRAISVLAVLAYHGGLSWAPGGFLGVEVFFVISGYLITSLLVAEHRRDGHISLAKFWGRRARRLLPALYALLIAVVIAAFVAAPDALKRMRLDVPAAMAYVSNWAQIIHHDSYFTQAGRPPLLSHLWSLAVEEQFYLFIPVLAFLLLPRLRRGALSALAAAGGIGSAVLMAVLYHPGTPDPSHLYLATDTRLSGLLLGVALGLVWAPWRVRYSARRAAPSAAWVLDLVGLAGLLILGWAFWRVNEFDAFVYRGGFVVVDVATLAVIVALVHPAARFGSLLGLPPLRWLGRRSYGIYLWHWPVFQLTRPNLDLHLSAWAITAIRLGATAGLAAISYRWIETPIRTGALQRRWRERPRRKVRQLTFACGLAAVILGILVVGPVIRPDRSSAAQIAAAELRESKRSSKLSLKNLTGSSKLATTTVVTTTVPPTTLAPTTLAAPAVVDTAPPTTAAPTTTIPAPTTTLSPALIRVTAIGDSVMLGAKANMQKAIPAIAVDAQVSRQFGDAGTEALRLAAFGALGPIVVIHLGTNGPMSDGQLNKLLNSLSGREVILVTTHVPRPWQDLTNQRLEAAATRWPNVRIADWNTLSSAHPEWFDSDGTHLQTSGRMAYAAFILAAVQ
jgi:peptidoglycan/LPS O-acetylase OafA/YrhL